MNWLHGNGNFFRPQTMLGIAAICLLALTSLQGCRTTPPSQIMVEGADYHWATNNGERVMHLTKSGYMKIVALKIEWATK